MFQLKVHLLPGARFEKGRTEDAGYDLFSTIDVFLPPLTQGLYPVGIRTEFPPGWVGLVLDRGSMGIKGVMRQAGVIDSGFRNEWKVKLYNTGLEALIIKANEKAIAQVIFVPYGKTDPIFTDELSESERGLAWNGSTDKI